MMYGEGYSKRLNSMWREMKDNFPYKIGDRFEYDGNEFILCCVDLMHICALFTINGKYKGLRWHDPVIVKDYTKISFEDFDKMCGYQNGKDFKKIG